MTAHAGEEYEYELKVFNPPLPDGSSKQRKVELFSTNPQIIYAPDNSVRNLFGLAEVRQKPQKPTSLGVRIKSLQVGKSTTYVNCIDLNSAEIIEQFVIVVDAIVCPDGQADRPVADLEAPTKGMSPVAPEDKLQNVQCVVGKET